MEDGGQKLSELVEVERDLGRWRDVLPLYASVQIDLVDDVAEMLALGVPDFRLASLAAKVEALLDEIVELAGRGAPAARSVAALGSGRLRGARRRGNPGDDPARRSPRRPGLRSRRPLPAARLG